MLTIDMYRFRALLFSMLIFLSGPGLSGAGSTPAYAGDKIRFPDQDSVERQILFNGRLYRNSYPGFEGDPFLFTKDFLPGSVTIGGRTFRNSALRLRLDILNDELLITSSEGTIIQLNREMVEQFTLDHENKLLSFRKLEADSLNFLNGYYYVVYGGRTPLYIKYKKEIRLRNGPGEKDSFAESHRIYLVRNGIAYPVNSKMKLMRLLRDRKQELRSYIKSHRIRMSMGRPESAVPLLEFYDSLH